jgi:hypothetical protein
MPTHVTFSGETIEYEPTPVVAAIIDRMETILQDPRMTSDDMIKVMFDSTNPVMEERDIPPMGRWGWVTSKTLADPCYRVMRDIQYRKDYQAAVGKR